MRIIVCGTRGASSDEHRSVLKEVLDSYWPIDEIIHGDCPNSADELAGQYAQLFGVTEWAYPADWTKHGRAAGFIRNKQMAEIENVSQCVAIWDGTSRGTLDMIQQSLFRGIPVNIIPATLDT